MGQSGRRDVIGHSRQFPKRAITSVISVGVQTRALFIGNQSEKYLSTSTMNFPEAPIICCEFPMFNQAFGFSDNPDDVRSSLNSLCAYPYAEDSLDWCSPFLASYPDTLDVLPEQHLVPTFPFGCNLCEEPWIPSWHNGVPCTQQLQAYSQPTPGSLLNNTHPQFATATCPNPPFDASPVSLASNHSSNDSPPKPWDIWEASDSTVLASCKSAVVFAQGDLAT
jgi:hypothetical protein